ncbi:MAG: hypothetical protein ACI976_002628 [Aureispira sp.]|jgi:hypothetical protein
MALVFNNHGFITPSGSLISNNEELRSEFVDDDKFLNSTTRQEIFSLFQDYIKDFESEISDTFSILINGSFVTKKENPNDIDFVVFLDAPLFDLYVDLIEEKFDRDGAFKQYSEKIHAFVVREVQDIKEEGNFEYRVARAYWLGHFEKTKRRVRNVKQKKGFLEILF